MLWQQKTGGATEHTESYCCSELKKDKVDRLVHTKIAFLIRTSYIYVGAEALPMAYLLGLLAKIMCSICSNQCEN